MCALFKCSLYYGKPGRFQYCAHDGKPIAPGKHFNYCISKSGLCRYFGDLYIQHHKWWNQPGISVESQRKSCCWSNKCCLFFCSCKRQCRCLHGDFQWILYFRKPGFIEQCGHDCEPDTPCQCLYYCFCKPGLLRYFRNLHSYAGQWRN